MWIKHILDTYLVCGVSWTCPVVLCCCYECLFLSWVPCAVRWCRGLVREASFMIFLFIVVSCHCLMFPECILQMIFPICWCTPSYWCTPLMYSFVAAAKIILGCLRTTSHEIILKDLGLTPLFIRRQFHILKAFRAILFGQCPSFLSTLAPKFFKNLSDYSSRFHTNVQLPSCKTYSLLFFS